MNREIKFRGYAEKYGMLGIDNINTDTFVASGYKTKGDYIPFHYDGKYKDGELMQYTGLKDKNGKEIYEGDIISVYINDEIIYGEIKYEECYHGIKFSHNSYLIILSEKKIDNLQIGVEGNIYENQDMLTKHS